MRKQLGLIQEILITITGKRKKLLKVRKLPKFRKVNINYMFESSTKKVKLKKKKPTKIINF